MDETGQENYSNYSELYREVADALYAKGHYQNALKFYEPLKETSEKSDATFHIQMGKCFLKENLGLQAEECFQIAIQVDENDIEARMQLAKMYEDLNERKQAFIFVSEIIRIRKRQPQILRKRYRKRANGDDGTLTESKRNHRSYKRHRLADPAERLKEESARAKQLQDQYFSMQLEHEGMRNEDTKSTQAWMEAAQDLTDDFRSLKNFYPWDKYSRFLGYTADNRLLAMAPLDIELAAMADRLSQCLFP